MSRVADARLLVMSSTRDVDATRARLTRHGLPPFRVTVVPPEEGQRYLDLFNPIDIVLDTFPASGGTTAGDALWMGKPMVTLAADDMPASRRASVFLRSLRPRRSDRNDAGAVRRHRRRPRRRPRRASSSSPRPCARRWPGVQCATPPPAPPR